MNIHKLVSTAHASEKQITIEATVVTGFEDVVLEECLEKLGKETLICTSTGRVFFNIDIKDIGKVRELRGIDNIFLIISSFEDFGFTNNGTEEVLVKENENNSENKLKDISTVKRNALQIDWKKYMSVWQEITNYKGILYPSIEQFEKHNTILRHEKNTRHDVKKTESELPVEENEKTPLDKNVENVYNNIVVDKKEKSEQDLLKFRVTCNRVGKHTVSSGDSERAFGGTLNDAYLWLVDLDTYDIDINLNIRYNEAYVALSVTQKSLHRRNIVEFNLTTLKATIAYNMIRLAAPKAGEIFLDPMCGGGTIPIECALSFPLTYFLSGDINEKLVLKTQANVAHNSHQVRKELYVSPLVCNVRRLCFKPSCVDGVVTDLPFGKRVGSKSNNYYLYREFLVEIGKLVKPKVGRAVLLTSDRKHLFQALHVTSSLWKCGKHFKINMSGIKSFVFILNRSGDLFDYALHGLKEKHRGTPLPPKKST